MSCTLTPASSSAALASRGAAGGIATPLLIVAALLDAAGFDLIFVETVGAGQSEVEIARVAETVMVVEAPGLGDDVQAIKAGILEIADILVVNKADRDGAEATISVLKAVLALGATARASWLRSECKFSTGQHRWCCMGRRRFSRRLQRKAMASR